MPDEQTPIPKSATVTVTGYTAQKMQQLSAENIIQGQVVGNDLILTQRGGNQFNAGRVRGETGAVGPQGPVGPNANPTGTIIMGGWETSPEGYLILNGQRVLGGVITYPDLADMFPTWIDNNDLLLPNADTLVPMASSAQAGVVAGSMSHGLLTTNIPTHSHVVPAHGHTGVVQDAGSHSHVVSANTSPTGNHLHSVMDGAILWSENEQAPPAANMQLAAVGAPYSVSLGRAVFRGDGSHSHSVDGTALTAGQHGHGLSIADKSAFTTQTTGEGAPINHTPRHITVKMAVKF